MGIPLFVKEQDAGAYIPYSVQVSPSCVKTWSGDYVVTMRLEGAAHETTDPEDKFLWKEQLNNLWRNTLSHPKVSLYTHIIRRKQNAFPAGEFEESFCDGLNKKYKDCLSKSTMMVNELYVSIVYRPNLGVVGLFGKKSSVEDLPGQIETLTNVTNTIFAGLGRYDPYLLTTYTNKHGVVCSEPLEFFHYLCNGEWKPVALPEGPLSDYIMTARPFFGGEAMELRQPTQSRFGAILGIKEYIESTAPGIMDVLLKVPFEYVLTQSFEPIVKAEALTVMQRTEGRMLQSADKATSLIVALPIAMDDVSVGRIVMGYHHWSLLVYADSVPGLRKNFAEVTTQLADLGLTMAREDLALESAFWAQLPGNFSYRARPSMISSKNFCGFAGFHNFPVGRIAGNQWGPAVTVLRTVSGSPCYFNFHIKESKDKRDKNREEDYENIGDDREKKLLANTLITGRSGSGKTFLQSFFIAQAQKFKPTTFIFDKDRGLDLFTRRIGGVYLPLGKGYPTGMNPLCLANTPQNAAFLESFIKTGLLTPSSENDPYHVSVKEEQEIAQGVRGVLALPQYERSLSHVLSFLSPTNENGAWARLAKWAANDGEGRTGSLAWVFDSGPDMLDFSTKRTFGFDITEFLEDDLLRPAITMYLFYRMEGQMDGRNFIGLFDEFWKMLQDSYFQDLVNNKLFTIRKQNGLLLFGTQSPSQIIPSPLSKSIIEQCPNQLFLYNPGADERDYVDGFKLSRTAFKLFKKITPESRLFLLRQGLNSSLASLSLHGDFSDELAVMSGTTDNVLLFDQIRAQYPDLAQDSDEIWRIFHRERRRAA